MKAWTDYKAPNLIERRFERQRIPKLEHAWKKENTEWMILLERHIEEQFSTRQLTREEKGEENRSGQRFEGYVVQHISDEEEDKMASYKKRRNHTII